MLNLSARGRGKKAKSATARNEKPSVKDRRPFEVTLYRHIHCTVGKAIFTRGAGALSNEEIVLQYQTSRQESERRQLLSILYKQNEGFIGKIAARYDGLEDMQDLKQEAFFGLVKAADNWKPDGGANFITYAAYWIQSAVRRYLDDCGSIIRIPVHERERVFRYQNVCKEYEATFGRPAPDNVLTERLGITCEQLREIRKAESTLRIRSTAEPVSFDSETTISDLIVDPRNVIAETEDGIRQEQLYATIWKAVDSLSERESAVIQKRYREGKTLEQTATELCISNVADIEKRALRKMRRGMIAKALRPFLEDKAIQHGFQSSGLDTFKKTFTSSVERAVLETEDVLNKIMELYDRNERCNQTQNHRERR